MTDLVDRLNVALAGRYAVERELGQGGMATVYLAQDLKHHRPVAIKLLRHELAVALGAERFLREIEIAARLTHPHILPIHDSGQAGELLYYVMPYIAGESLRDRLTREKQLSIEDALQITRDVGKALDYSHNQGVIHRDIKPENILLSTGTAVVADFGIARALGTAGGERLTGTGLALGTPAYMSPEQATGGDVDQRSDLYSLACVLYEMLAGQPPFTGPTVESLVTQHLAVAPRLVNALRPAVSTELAQILDRALAKTPADRFPSAAQMLAALQPGSLSPPRGFPLAVPARTPRRARALGLGLLTLGIAALAAYGAFRWRTQPAVDSSGRIMLAVLPFENLGSPDDEYFADGLSEEIANRLGALPGLGVIARSSANQYRKTTKSARQIADELGVTFLLEGSVRWEKAADGSSRVRVSPQLIRASDGTRLWGERYDAVLASVFDVQASVADRVAGALGMALGTAGHTVTRPTESLEAYDFHLRGNEFYNRETWEGALLALQMYERAAALDPRFAHVYARMGRVHVYLQSSYDLAIGHMPLEERMAKARTAIDRALELAPDLAEAHLALGEYFSVVDPARAPEEIATAFRLEPGNVEVITAFALSRPLQEREPYLLRAAQLDPRSFLIARSLAALYERLGRFAEAESQLDRAILLAPDNPEIYGQKVWLAVRVGDLGKARQVLRAAEASIGRVQWLVYLTHRTEDQILLRIFRDDYRESVLGLSQEAFAADTLDRLWVTAEQYWLIPDRRRARVYFDSVRVLVESQLRAEPKRLVWHWALAQVSAGLGRREQLLRELEVLRGLGFSNQGTGPAMWFLMAGEPDSAVARLEAGTVRTWKLQPDPIWDPLRGDPRFQQLLVQRQGMATASKN